jgi:hypothetical protein
MRAAIVLHLYYPDIARELIARVAGSDSRIDLIVTTPVTLQDSVIRALDALPNVVTVVRVANHGWDIGPLFEILPMLIERNYEIIGKLHTKQGTSGQAAFWRGLFFDALIGGPATVDRLIALFEKDPDLDLVGPAALYKSAAAHQFANGEPLELLLPRIAAPAIPPSDWGFFAGAMFWARRRILERLAPFAAFGATDDHERRDGTNAHLMERLFGLVPALAGRRIGLIQSGDDMNITIMDAPGLPSHDPIMQTLISEAEASAGIVDAALARRIVRTNPLLHYIRHGRDPDALDPNPYFSSTWYNSVNADVFAAGVHPLTHYLHNGAFEDRSTGPLFDMGYYVANNPEVRAEGWDPLRHFLEVGLPAGRRATPAADARDDGPSRFQAAFDLDREHIFFAGLPDASETRAMMVSVIMPVYDRADRVASAIRSVLAQTHAHFELLIVDDGSTDGSIAVIKSFLADPRLRLIRADHGGVSRARNLGLSAARGEIIAYLDSDNRWKPWFLDVMLRFMTQRGSDAAYSAIEIRNDRNHLVGYRGADFDWATCLQQNYVDLNAFCHRITLLHQLGGFDIALRRMVDWDLILRYSRVSNPDYAPFVGCEYFDGQNDRRRITIAEPVAFAKVVRAKHQPDRDRAPLAAPIPLSFAIKIAAPESEKIAWGDHHFATSLSEALKRLGHVVHIDYRDHWYSRPVGHEDVAIILRGLIAYNPKPGQIVFLWNISHPDQVGFAEYDGCTRIYCASASHAALLQPLVSTPVGVLLQATDPDRFHPVMTPPPAPPILFCGNSRGVNRDIVRWGLETGRAPTIYGGGWDGKIPDDHVVAATIDNARLGPLYAGAGVVLNDHWPAMRAFGIVSNRLFDIVASGGQAVSDPVPSIATIFGDAVAEVSGAADYARTVDRLLAAPRPVEQRLAAARAVLADHGFDDRARRIVGDAYRVLGLIPPAAQPADQRIRVHIVTPHGPNGPQSSFYIRLLSPLTDDSVAHRIAMSFGDADVPLPPCEVCIVQRTALPSIDAANALIRDVGKHGAVLVTDIDDAFSRMDGHPEQAHYAPRNAALERIVAAAAESWFSTEAVLAAYPQAVNRHVIPNALDPRLWRDYRRPPPPVLQGDTVRILYMGTATHAADFAMIRPALDRLAAERPNAFDLTLIGVTPDGDPAPWLRRLSPPADVIAYPRFVRWLRAQGQFDIGLAPLLDTAFNAAKSDIKLLDYAALGLLPVVSDGPAYGADRDAADHAVRVKGSADAWHRALSAVLDDRHDHAGRAARLHAHLWAARSVNYHARVLADRIARLGERVKAW